MPPSAEEFEKALRELRRLHPHADCSLRTYRGCDFREFIVSLQDNLNTIAKRALLCRLTRTLLVVASVLRLEGD